MASRFRPSPLLWYRGRQPLDGNAKFESAKTTMNSPSASPRLVLVTTPLGTPDEAAAALGDALSAGDVASVILHQPGADAGAYQAYCETTVPIVQAAGAAAIVVDDTRCAGRVRADGIHLTDGKIETLREALERHAPKLIVGVSGYETRHDAMEAGELFPDYLFFGRLGGDTSAEPHHKTLSLAGWWAQIMELPCIAFAGAEVESVRAAAATGAEFVAVSAAVFGEGARCAEMVERANAILSEFRLGEAA